MYVPVIHAGYQTFLDNHSDADEILLLGDGFRKLFPQLAKDIRALDPHKAAGYLSVATNSPIRVVQPDDISDAIIGDTLAVPNEQVMHDIVSRYNLQERRKVLFEKTFLRWDRDWSLALKPGDFDGAMTSDEFARKFIEHARRLSERSSDWWRQVGAIAVKDGRVIGEAWNHHHPTEYSPYIDGDPRDAFSRAIRPDLSTAIHAEAALIAHAAREGFSLAGADLYSTTFPCPACSRLIAETGFRRCYFADRYSVLDGDRILHAAGIEIIYVDETSL
jgi:dCMP deaminase